MSFRILTHNQISARGLARFPLNRYEVGADITEPDAIVVRSAELHGAEIDVHGNSRQASSRHCRLMISSPGATSLLCMCP